MQGPRVCCECSPWAHEPAGRWRQRDANGIRVRQVRAEFRGDRSDAGRGRRRQGREPGGAVADRRHRRAGWLLCDDGCVPDDHGASAVDRRSTRPAVAPEPGRPGVDPHAQRRDPPDPRSDRHPRRSGGRDHQCGRPARRTDRLRRAIERDGRGPADGLVRRPAGHVPQHRGAGRGPPPRQPVLGVAVHRAGRDLPPAQRLRPPEGPHGRGRAADGRARGGRRPVHGRPRHVEPHGRRRGGHFGLGEALVSGW